MNWTRSWVNSIFPLAYFNLYFIACDSYKHVKLQSYELCAAKPFKRIYDLATQGPQITLDDGAESSAIIEQTWNFSDLPKIRDVCKFRINPTSSHTGLYIILNHMNFRKDPMGVGCHDYIQFSENRDTTDKKICGQITSSEKFYFMDYRKVKVNVFVDRKRPFEGLLQLRMVITSHGLCSGENDFVCDPEDYRSCISKQFVNDGVVNCFPPHCRDEIQCNVEAMPREEPLDTPETVLTAIISFIFTMTAVGSCLWVCWKYRECRGADQNSIEIETNEIPTIEVPSAPSDGINDQQPRAPSPKDLPPSYDSLFPER